MGIKEFCRKLGAKTRVAFYKWNSTCEHVEGDYKCTSPVFFAGNGRIILNGVWLGYYPSPFYFNCYSYIEARKENAIISIGEGTVVNNNFHCVANEGGITIGSGCLIGVSVEILNCDFHPLSVEERHMNTAKSKDIYIGDNVFIGNNVKILKGVHIGDYAVIANGAVVTKDVAAKTIVAGNPAEVIKNVNESDSKNKSSQDS